MNGRGSLVSRLCDVAPCVRSRRTHSAPRVIRHALCPRRGDLALPLVFAQKPSWRSFSAPSCCEIEQALAFVAACACLSTCLSATTRARAEIGRSDDVRRGLRAR